MDSVKSGRKNGSSLPVLRGTLPGAIINWLGVVADLCHWEASLVSWMQELGEIINLYGWVRLLTCITWAKKMVFFSCELA